jgi:hypothetical protein
MSVARGTRAERPEFARHDVIDRQRSVAVIPAIQPVDVSAILGPIRSNLVAGEVIATEHVE